MATSEVPAIERLGAGEIDAGLALSAAAGWNQTADDWAFFIDAGETLGLRDEAGHVVATAAALPYGGAFGWISMVLVDAAHRHRGLATRLIDACVTALRRAGRVPVLDATPEGAEVYRRIGFVSGFAFDRWERAAAAVEPITIPGRSAADRPIEARRDVDVDDIVALDAAAHRIDRGALMRAFVRRSGTRAWLAATRDGFVVARAGRRATQIGPLVAARTADALTLVDTALATVPGGAFIDVPARATSLVRWLEQRGFVKQRSFVRMALGDGKLLTADLRMFALAGPEFG